MVVGAIRSPNNNACNRLLDLHGPKNVSCTLVHAKDRHTNTLKHGFDGTIIITPFLDDSGPSKIVTCQTRLPAGLCCTDPGTLSSLEVLRVDLSPPQARQVHCVF